MTDRKPRLFRLQSDATFEAVDLEHALGKLSYYLRMIAQYGIEAEQLFTGGAFRVAPADQMESGDEQFSISTDQYFDQYRID